MNDVMPGDSFRSIVARLQKDNSQLLTLYKNTVALLAISAAINAALLFAWLLAIMAP